MNNKFWNWVKNEETNESELFFNGPISEDTWFGDEITPALFRNELSKISGNITVWINSPGGDVFAASQIYTMLRNHNGKVTVKIDGIAASAASVVAMAGDETLITPTGMLMIHNPATIAIGNNLYSHDYEADWDTNHFGKEMIKYAENITYGADTAIFNIGSTRQKSGHSMVCFGLEFRDYASDKNNARWNGWDARFLIYDMNNHSYDSAEYFYVNFTDGSWYSSLFSKYGYDTTKNRINMTHSYDKMVAAYNYGMTADEFFDAIKLK